MTRRRGRVQCPVRRLEMVKVWGLQAAEGFGIREGCMMSRAALNQLSAETSGYRRRKPACSRY